MLVINFNKYDIDSFLKKKKTNELFYRIILYCNFLKLNT